MTLHEHCQCDFCSGVDCGADDPVKRAEEERKQKVEARNAVLDNVYKRLESLAVAKEGGDFVEWSDIDCLIAELKDEP